MGLLGAVGGGVFGGLGGVLGGGGPHLFEVVHSEGEVLQGEEDLLQEGDVVGGLGGGEPRVEQFVPPHTDEPGGGGE